VTKPHSVLDVVVFSLKPGTTRERFLDTVDAVSRWAQDQPGFISRELSYAEADDRWIEIVRWSTAGDADRAAEAEQTAEARQPMFGLIDWDSILVMRADPAIPAVLGNAEQPSHA